MDIIKNIANKLGFTIKQINTVIELLESGNTIPFIARYRKEMTDHLDEVEILSIKENFDYVSKLELRKKEVIQKIIEKGKLTKELELKIINAEKLKTVEDLYRPFIEKKNTLAQKAKEKGLENIAEKVFSLPKNLDLAKLIEDETKNNPKVKSKEEVLDGVKEIIKEKIVEDVEIRENVHTEYFEKSFIVSKLKDDEKDKTGIFKPYYDYKEELKKVPSHRLLAMKRGESEGVLKLSYDVDREVVLTKIKEKIINGKKTNIEAFVDTIVKESYSKSLKGSIEREITSELKESSDLKAVEVFKNNLENLLMVSPIKGRNILGFDPAYRTGCKLAVIDDTGTFLDKEVIYPHAPINKREESKKKLKEILNKYNVTLVAIGNGTASRESEQFVVEVFKELEEEAYSKGILRDVIEYVIVNEAGASVYSASELAREEFPNLKVEERSAISIARRLLDPLAELVKIDPKSLGIGQYQHDVDKKLLKNALDFVIQKVVNRVGINVNTASVELLSHVSGLNKTIAKNIVEHRNKYGCFTSRIELKKVKGLGPKAYEQSVGFLRIYDGKNKLDETGIHPDNYKETKKILKFMNIKESELGTKLISDHLKKIRTLISSNDTHILDKVGTSLDLFEDILSELEKPRRDIREELSKVLLRRDVLTLEDVKKDMEFTGTVRNVVDFGLFVDIGLKNDGLVHISKISDNQYVNHPSDLFSVGDIVKVFIENIDLINEKVSLRMFK